MTRAIIFATVLAATGQPAPLPDASPELRGAVNTGIQWYRGPKGHLDQITVIADAGAAYASSCVVNSDALGACPARGNVLQCVNDAGWYGCQTDDAGNRAWAQLGAGATGAANVTATSPIAASAGNVSIDSTKNLTMLRFISTDTAAGSASDGGGNFICRNNVAQSSPCVNNPIGPLEIGGSCQNGDCSGTSAGVYIGVEGLKTAGPTVCLLNNYGQGTGTEQSDFCSMANGDGVFGGSIHLNTFSSTDSRVISDHGALYLISDQSGVAAPIYVWSKGNGDVMDWFSGPGGTQVGSFSSGGVLTVNSSVLTELDAKTFNAPIEIVGNCNPATTTCAALDVENTAPNTSNKIQKWGSGGVEKAALYNTGTFDNYPANLSTNILFGNIVQDVTGSSGLQFISDRPASSVSPDFIFNTSVTRTSGSLCQWWNAGAARAQIDPTGMFIGGVGGVGSFAAFQDGSGVSGHPSLTASTGFYVTLMGRLGEDHNGILPDGGRPAADGGHWVVTESDGGTFFAYGGVHGDVTVIDSWSSSSADPHSSSALFLQQWQNPWIDGVSKGGNSFIDHSGAFMQRSTMGLADFEALPTLVFTNLGQFYFGQFESALMYAFGSGGSEHHWFVQGPANPDGGLTYDFNGPGGGWRQLPYADEVPTFSASPSGLPSRQTMKSDDSTFVAGAKEITLGAQNQFALTPQCWCNDTAAASAGSPSGCQYDVANSNNAIVAFVGISTHTFHYWCMGR